MAGKGNDAHPRRRYPDRMGPPPGRRRQFHFRSIQFGAAAIAAAVGGATRSGRLGGAAAAGRRSPSGRRWSSGARGDRRATGSSPTGALKDQRFRGRVPPLYPLTRAHEGRADPATLVSRATRDRPDPLAPPAGRRRQFLNLGWGWCGRRGAGFGGVVGGAGRAQEVGGLPQTRGIERPAV